MKLIRQTQLTFLRGTPKVYEVDLLQLEDDQYVVNFRYGKRGGALKEGSKTPLPVGEAEAEALFAKLVADKIEQGYQTGDGAPGSGGRSPVAAGAPPGPSRPGGRRRPPSPPPAVPPSPPPPRAASLPQVEALLQGSDPRERAILTRLVAGSAHGGRQPWPLSRVVWRAGELGLKGAEGPLLALLTPKASVLNHSVVWALGRCGSRQAIPPLQRLLNDGGCRDLHPVAIEALLTLWNDDERAAVRRRVQGDLPKPLVQALAARDAEAVEGLLPENPGAPRGGLGLNTIDALYVLDDPVARRALIQWLDTAPLTSPSFATVRRLFKRAEYRRDAEIFGLIAHRMETSPPQPGRRRPFGEVTRAYLRRRVWRTLRRLGEDNSPDYVPMAAGVLRAFGDGDGRAPREGRIRLDGRLQRVHWDRFAGYWTFNHILYRHSPRYVGTNQRRFWHCARRYRPGDPPPPQREEAFPALWTAQPQYLLALLEVSRCEVVHVFATRALGDCGDYLAQVATARLAGLLPSPYQVTLALGVQLLMARYTPGAEGLAIAVALADCRHGEARRRALTWLRRDQRHHLLAAADSLAQLVASAFDETRAGVHRLLQGARLDAAVAHRVVAQLMAQLDAWGAAVPGAGDDQRQALAVRAQGVVEVLEDIFDPQLGALAAPVVEALLAHPLAVIQRLGASVVFYHWEPQDVPVALLQRLLDSDDREVRRWGTQILARWSVTRWLAHRDWLVDLWTHPRGEVRQALVSIVREMARADAAAGLATARELLERLARTDLAPDVAVHLAAAVDTLFDFLDPMAMATATLQGLMDSDRDAVRGVGARILSRWPAAHWPRRLELLVELCAHRHREVREPFQGLAMAVAGLGVDHARALAGQLVDKLLSRRLADDVPEHLAALVVALKDALAEDLPRIQRLLQSRRAATQNAGAACLTQLPGTVLPLETVFALASHESLTVRRWAWNACADDPQRVSQILPQAIKMLDSDWEDTRGWAQGFFLRGFETHHWDPAVLVAVCDSNRAAVQDFGRQLLTRFFDRHSGPEYLLKLSEHPSQNVQLFVSQLLERYGADDVERLAALVPFFVQVLSLVNRGRVIKTRVLRFMEVEGLKSEAAARLLGPVLARQSATEVGVDKGALLKTMVQFKRRYPDLPLPLRSVVVETRVAS